MRLTEKYAPRALSDLVGQEPAVAAMRRWLANPFPIAWLLSGASGCGKTSAGMCLARELGVGMDQQEYGGFYQLASGEQTADSVRRTAKLLRNIPMFGSGWKAVIINECDVLSPQAEAVWLDVLENIPPHTAFVFTTNNLAKLSDRFADRCTSLQFRSAADDVKGAAKDLVRRVWSAEGMPGSADDAFKQVRGLIRDGHISFRRCVEAVQQFSLAGV
jgi:DNA polymerase III gamma/tau subunit